MTYSSVSDLPPQVKTALGEEEQEQWLSVYNDTASQVKAWDSVKDARRLEFIANAELIDQQNDEVKAAALLKAMPAYIEAGGPLLDSHSNRIIGTVYDYASAVTNDGIKAVKCKAVVFRGQRLYDNIWQEIKSGVKPAVSIGADILSKHIFCNDEGCHSVISGLHLIEISVVDKPANPEAIIESANFAAKSNVPEESGKENEIMSEEEQTAQAPPEEDMEKSELPSGLEEFMAMVIQRLDALESKKEESTEPIDMPKEEEITAESSESEETCKCKKNKVDEILEARKRLEFDSKKSVSYAKTPLPGSAEGIESTIELPADGRLMKTAEIDALIPWSG